jgi:hypothetical protein
MRPSSFYRHMHQRPSWVVARGNLAAGGWASVPRFSPVNHRSKNCLGHYPLAPSNVPCVTGGDVLAHFGKVFLTPRWTQPSSTASITGAAKSSPKIDRHHMTKPSLVDHQQYCWVSISRRLHHFQEMASSEPLIVSCQSTEEASSATPNTSAHRFRQRAFSAEYCQFQSVL